MNEFDRLFMTLNNAYQMFEKIYENVEGDSFKINYFRGMFTKKTSFCILQSSYFDEEKEFNYTRDDIVNAILEVQQETDTLLEYHKSF